MEEHRHHHYQQQTKKKESPSPVVDVVAGERFGDGHHQQGESVAAAPLAVADNDVGGSCGGNVLRGGESSCLKEEDHQRQDEGYGQERSRNGNGGEHNAAVEDSAADGMISSATTTCGQPTIRKLSQSLVRRLVSGTAIDGLNGVVKELVDNALDAGACTVNVRLFNGGLDIVEVSDDGVGVPQQSRPFLALPHATSKLESIEQLQKSTRTLGFRGEALFSLASTSRQLIVATRSADEDMATKLTFKRDGSLDVENSQETFPKKIGTTVAVVGFLERLPVRRSDLINRIAQERQKLVALFESYAIFRVGTQMRLMDMVGKHCRENVVVATTMHARTIKDNIGTVLGTQALQSLCEITVDLTDVIGGGEGKRRNSKEDKDDAATDADGGKNDEDAASGDDDVDLFHIDSDDDDSDCDDDDDDDDDKPRFRIHGMISMAGDGSGRQQQQSRHTHGGYHNRSRDRQYFCVNGRPVDLPPLQKVLNALWKSLPLDTTKRSRPKKPSCYLHLTIPPSSFDVNLSPDKRQVLLVKEKEICHKLQIAVSELWSSQTEGTFAVNASSSSSMQQQQLKFTKAVAATAPGHPENDEDGDKVNYESPVQSDDDDDDDDNNNGGSHNDDLSPSRFNRRYAFSHDIKKARLQHEYDDGRQKKQQQHAADNQEQQQQQQLDEDGDSDGVVDDEVRNPSVHSLKQRRSLSQDEEQKHEVSAEEHRVRHNQPDMSGGPWRRPLIYDGSNPSSSSSNNKRRRLDNLKLPLYTGEDDEEDHDEDKPAETTTAARATTAITPSPANHLHPDNGSGLSEGCPVGSLPESSEDRWTGQAAVAATDATFTPTHHAAAHAGDRMIPAERRRWMAMQRTFNGSGSSGIEDDIQRTAGSTAMRKGTSIVGQTFASKNSCSTPQFGLERFGFGFRGSAAVPAPRRVTTDSSAKDDEETTTTGLNELSTATTEIEASMPARQYPTTSVSSKRRPDNSDRPEGVRGLGGVCQRLKSSVIEWDAVDDAVNKRPKASSGQNSGDADNEGDADRLPTARDADDEECEESCNNIPPVAEPFVTWDSFTGTNDVILAARAERLAMRERMRKLHGLTSADRSNDNIVENLQAADTTQREQTSNVDTTICLSKKDFGQMQVIGQFNMGFILAKSPDNNLWILDQHACDEKYNFERLCRETVIHEQRLLVPMPLDLTPAEETCVMDHMDLFEKNGFRFQVDLDKPPRHRLSITGLPHSGAQDGRKAVQFGKDDVAALCSILGVAESSSSYDGAAGAGTGSDGSGMYGNNAVRRYAGSAVIAPTGQDTADQVFLRLQRLPKAVAMFASRACRQSIMIGKALSPNEMDRIVKRLESLDSPWNCPHGRPTMRHVANLQSHLQADEQKARGRIAGPTVTISSQEMEEG